MNVAKPSLGILLCFLFSIVTFAQECQPEILATCEASCIRLSIDPPPESTTTWSDGSVGADILVCETGTYSVSVETVDCAAEESYEVLTLPTGQTVDAGPDTTYCGLQASLLHAEGIEWSINCLVSGGFASFETISPTETDVVVSEYGIYELIASLENGSCHERDTALVHFKWDGSISAWTDMDPITISYPEVPCPIAPPGCSNVVNIGDFTQPIPSASIGGTTYSNAVSTVATAYDVDGCEAGIIDLEQIDFSDSENIYWAGAVNDYLENYEGSISEGLFDFLSGAGGYGSCEIDSIVSTVVDSIEYDIVTWLGGYWTYTTEYFPDTSYVIKFDPDIYTYAPLELTFVQLLEDDDGEIFEIPASGDAELQWVDEWDVSPGYQYVYQCDVYYADDCINCGSIFIGNIGPPQGPAIPDFPCGPVSVSFGGGGGGISPDVVYSDCFIYINNPDPGWEIEWGSGGSTSSGDSHFGSPGEVGNVTLNISYDDGCDGGNYSGEYWIDCVPDCPHLLESPIFPTTVCEGETVYAEIMVDDEWLAEFVWVFPDGSISHESSIAYSPSPVSDCNETQTIEYAVICLEDGSYMDNGVLSYTLYTEITGVTTAGGCAASISLDCPDLVVMEGSDSYSAAPGESGSVTFTVMNPGAPAGCELATFQTTVDCPEPCPVFTGSTLSSTELCELETIDAELMLDYEWLAEIIWSLPDESTATGSLLSYSCYSSSGCTETQSIGYEIICMADGSLIASGSLSYTVYPEITAEISIGGCSAGISSDCPEFTASWSTYEDSGSDFFFTATEGESGPVIFTVMNPGAPAGCSEATFEATVNCPEPECEQAYQPSLSSFEVCEGETIEIFNLSGNTSEIEVDWILPDGSTISEPYFNYTPYASCTEVQELQYVAHCALNGELLATGGLAYTVYPEIIYTQFSTSCNPSVTPVCPEIEVSWQAGAQTGQGEVADLYGSGTVVFTLTNPNAPAGCNVVSTSSDFDCPEICPSNQGPANHSSVVCTGPSSADIPVINLTDDNGNEIQWFEADGTLSQPIDLGSLYNSSCSITSFELLAFVECDGSLVDLQTSWSLELVPELSSESSDGDCSSPATVRVLAADGAICDEAVYLLSHTADCGDTSEESFTFEHNYFEQSACPQMIQSSANISCETPIPAFFSHSKSTSICEGDLVDTDSYVQELQDLNPDLELSNFQWFMDAELTEAALPEQLGLSSSTGCGAQVQELYLAVDYCGIEEAAAGIYELNVYHAQIEMVAPEKCSRQIVADCSDQVLVEYLQRDGTWSTEILSPGALRENVQWRASWMDAPDANLDGMADCYAEGTFEVVCPLEFAIPNAFSPNADGINDVFRPIFNVPDIEAQLLVVDRWGKVMYEAKGSDSAWDGEYRGESQPLGVYAFLVSYVDEEGERQQRSGNVTLIR